METGQVVEIIGAVIDVKFPRESMPKVYDALKVDESNLTLGSSATDRRRNRKDDCNGFH